MATGEGVPVDLLFAVGDGSWVSTRTFKQVGRGEKHGIHGVIHEDGACVNTGTHLASWAAEGREELGVDQSRFLVFQSVGYIPGKSEIGILVDGARNQRRDFLDFLCVSSKDVREGGGESRASLDGCKVHLSDIVSVSIQISYDFDLKILWSPTDR